LEITALQNAIAAAESVYKSSGSSQLAVNAAVTALNEALDAFKAARKPGTGARNNTITISGFDTATYPNNSRVSVVLFATADAIDPFSTPEISGGASIQNGAVRVYLFKDGDYNTPWDEDVSMFVGFMVETEKFTRAFVSKTPVSFTADNPNPSIFFSNLNKFAFSNTLGNYDGSVFSDTSSMTMNQWINKKSGGDFENYADYLARGGIPFYKNKELTQPFSGSDTVNANTVIYSESPIVGRGQKNGELTGKITLTGIPSPLPKVYISAHQYNFISSRSEIKGITGTSGTFDWSIPVYEYDPFESRETQFRLWVQTGSSLADGFYIYIPGAKNLSNRNEDVGNLGTVSIASITLSGTINVTNNGNPVPRVEITVYVSTSYDPFGSTRLTSPAANAPWSITIPALNAQAEISFRIDGYSSNGDELFGDWYTPDPPISVWNQDRSGIPLSMAYQSVTLSGTINVTYNGNNVPDVRIDVYGESGSLGSITLTSPAANAPWSITIPALDAEEEIYFHISGYISHPVNPSSFGDWYYPDPPVSVWKQDVSGISLSMAYKTVTLSGTITATYGGNNVSRVRIQALGYDAQKQDWISESTYINSPNANTPWSITIQALSAPTEFSFSVYGYDGWNTLFVREDIVTRSVSNQDVSGIALNVAVQSITLSGTLNVIYGGRIVPEVDIQVLTEDHDLLGVTSLTSPGTDATWSMTIEALDSPKDILFQIKGETAFGYYLFNEYYTPNPAIPVSNINVSGIVIDLGDLTNTFEPPSNATPLISGQWEDGVLANGGEAWYSFTATTSEPFYVVWWNGHGGVDISKTADVRVEAYDSDGFKIFERDNIAWSSQGTVWDVDGTVYIKVSPYDNEGGTYAITYNTSATMPPWH
jgi:hypothetical protein